MKKVLAFVLAAIMVCTMAFAAGVSPVQNGTTGGTTTTYNVVTPGSKIYLDLLADGATDVDNGALKFYFDGDDNFVADKNVVKVTFDKGSDLVASQGWVKKDAFKTDSNKDGWVYEIKTKEALATGYFDDTKDISISKATLKAWGETEVTVINNTTDNTAFAYGYPMANLYINADKDLSLTDGGNVATLTELTKDTVYKVVKSDGVNKDNGSIKLLVDTVEVKLTLKAGNRITVKDDTLDSAALKNLQKNINNNNANEIARYDGANAVYTNTTATLTVKNAEKTYNIYAIDGDGNVALIKSTFDDGVMTASVKNVSAFVVVDGTLTATGAAAATSTNPNTGANDVIGVAAALAVVALVSGAAISLKK